MSQSIHRANTEGVYCESTPSRVVPEVEESQYGTRAHRYTPLRDVDEIRLLRIAPRTDSKRGGGLKATIHHVYLSDSPLYTAVSWMWGPRQDLVDLEINDWILPIQANLARIIQDLQDDREARDLWIDAICIDQETLEERNHQVQLMGKIYSNANYVVACLMAERPKDRRKLAKTAEQVHRVFERCLRKRSTASISTSNLSSDYRLFFDHRYFTRRWIIQEIIQARSVILCCEGYQMPMRILEGVFDNDRQLNHSERSSDYMKDLTSSKAMRFCRLRQEMDQDSLSIEELLYTHETAECADFRDRVYALLSLSKQAKEQLPVRYDINRIELMLSVAGVSRMYEDLSPLRTLSFTCFLRQHLKVETRMIQSAMISPPLSVVNTRFILQGVVRGTIRSHRINLETEAAAQKVRDLVPALHVLRKIDMEFFKSPHDEQDTPTEQDIPLPLHITDRQPSRIGESNAAVVIPGVDQCLFAFEGDDSRTSSRVYREQPRIAGLASTKTDIGDEIWQFERTPLAIVARPTSKGFTLIGRAYLLKDLSTGCHTEVNEVHSSYRRKLEDHLIWVKDATMHSQQTPIVDVDVCGLLELMTWVTYDK